MNSMRYILICMLAVTLWIPARGNAEDIDIYSGLSGVGDTPNVLIVMDNAANFSSNAAGSTCVINGTPTALSGTVGGIEQCALYNVIQNLPVNADGSARVNIGMMVYNANNIRDVNNLNCGADSSTGGCLAQPLIPMDAANKTGFLNWIQSWVTTGGAGNGYVKASGGATAATMQEAWAYYYGATGLSGRSYAGIRPASGCQKNFVIFIGNSFSSSGSPGDGGSVSPATALDNAPGVTAAQKVRLTNTLTTSCGAYTFPTSASTHENGGYYADEWARYMNQADLYADPGSTQSIITYTVGILGASCRAEYAALLKNMADYGGGKYFATSDYASMVSAILQILNEIQAVNSVFASSSLPVSVNAQGTYLNQIYMGMFRPDAGAKPRWVGNLKQYSFFLDINNELKLGDSIGREAINAATGFVTPNAISHWTCSNSGNPYLTGSTDTVPNVTAAELTRLTSQGQICASDPVAGFWANTTGMVSSAGGAFDLADGELVEKGGAAQQMRLANLTNDYATAAGSATNPRKLYTFCPDGVTATCKPDLTHSDNAFATTNAAFTAGMFGGSSSVNISSLTRSGSTVTANTTSNHGFATGDSIAIANATPSAYNGTKVITKTSNTQFTYAITEYPPTPATGSYQTFAAAPKAVASLARASGGTTITATSTGHGFATGDTVIISGSGEPQYNGTFTVTRVNADTFTYTVLNVQETPPNAASGGTASKGSTTANIATVSRPAGSTTVTVTTAAAHGFPLGVVTGVTLANIVDAGGAATLYNKKRNINVTSTTAFTFTYPFGTGASADPAVSPQTVSNAGITASPTVASPLTILLITRSGNTATATTALPHGFANGNSIVISGTPAPNESAYLGAYTVSNAIGNTFDYTVVTTPATPATGAGGAIMTATGGVPDNDAMINWVRGADNNGDETGPGGAVTVRPSLHGDVLHSRPTVINYGGQNLRITATSDSAGTRTATASTTDIAKIGAVGAAADIKFANGQTCAVTVASTTTFQYSSSNCGAAGAQDVATTSSSTIVFYGDNSGVFHAVNGNQANPLGSTLPAPGGELWGFIPSEMFGKLNRLRTNSPQLELSTTPSGISPTPRPKEYFVDGPVGVYQDISENGTTLGAVIYLTMRRGGRIIYALDVSNPLSPKLKWKADNNTLWKVDGSGVVTTTSSGLGELGQTWSQPKVAKVASGGGKWVLIFGAGYDTNEDEDPPTAADTMGRGIFVLDAFTGDLVWKATYGASNSCTGSTTQASCTVAGMDYSIPADITLMDRDSDRYGYIDRLYAADTGGNIWRVDLETANGLTTPNWWRVYKLAALGCANGPCSIPPGTRTQRKFFYPPEVITTNLGYDAVIAGTGDREHPLYVDPDDTRTNRVVLLRDEYTGKTASGMTAITNDMLADIEDCANDYGFKYSLRRGEKVVNAPLVTAGSIYFGTNEPVSPTSNSCTSTLGIARGYKLEPFGCAAPTSVEFAGGGMPPSPVSGVVNIQNADGTITQVPFLIGGGEQGCVGSACGGSALEGQKPTINVPTTRTRTYWYRDGK